MRSHDHYEVTEIIRAVQCWILITKLFYLVNNISFNSVFCKNNCLRLVSQGEIAFHF